MTKSTRLAALRALSGGHGINGKQYRSGQFLPQRQAYALDEPARDSLPPTLDHDHLRTLDLHQAEPTWNKGGKETRNAYGGVVFNHQGQVLLVEPTNHYYGYHWTFPKGALDPGEHPIDTGLREVQEESGHHASILGLVPKRFPSPTGGNYTQGPSYSQYFVMKSHGQTSKPHWETQNTRWADPAEAHRLIDQTTNEVGKARDHEVLDLAVQRIKQLGSNPAINQSLRPGVKRQEYARSTPCSCDKCAAQEAIHRVIYAKTERYRLSRVRRIMYASQKVDPIGQRHGSRIAQWDENATPEDFKAARARTSRASHVIPSIGTTTLTGDEDFSGHKVVLSSDHRVGGLLSPSGDILGLFNAGAPHGAAAEAVLKLIKLGGRTADGFDGFLPHYLAQFGFKETGRMKFVREYAPKSWNYNYDEPDVIFMARHQREPFNEHTIRQQVAKRESWRPHELTQHYYDDWDQAKSDSRRAATPGIDTPTPGQGVGQRARGVDPGASQGARRALTHTGKYRVHPLNPFGLRMGDTVNVQHPEEPEPSAYHVRGFSRKGLPFYRHSAIDHVPATQEFNSQIVTVRGLARDAVIQSARSAYNRSLSHTTPISDMVAAVYARGQKEKSAYLDMMSRIRQKPPV